MYSFVGSFVSWISVNKVLYLTLVNLSSYYQRLTVVCHLTVQRIGSGQWAVVVLVIADARVYHSHSDSWTNDKESHNNSITLVDIVIYIYIRVDLLVDILADILVDVVLYLLVDIHI